MERSALDTLLELSFKQLQAVEKEDWTKFALFLREKEKIYNALSKELLPLNEDDRKRLEILRIKEKEIIKLLKSKKKAIINQLHSVREFRRAIKGYRPSYFKIKLSRFLSKKV